MTSSWPSSNDTFSTTKQDDIDAKSGSDLGLTSTTGDHATHHNDLADAVNKMQPSLRAALGRWDPIFNGHVNFVATAAGTYPITHMTTSPSVVTASAAFGTIAQYLNPADYAISGFTVQCRVVANFQQNTTANAGTSISTAGLYPMVMAGGTTVFTPTLGTVVTGSTAAQTGGAASSDTRVLSSTFTMPAAGSYTLAVVISVATRAGGGKINVRLEYCYV
jgi:hypothetical protein